MGQTRPPSPGTQGPLCCCHTPRFQTSDQTTTTDVTGNLLTRTEHKMGTRGSPDSWSAWGQPVSPALSCVASILWPPQSHHCLEPDPNISARYSAVSGPRGAFTATSGEGSAPGRNGVFRPAPGHPPPRPGSPPSRQVPYLPDPQRTAEGHLGHSPATPLTPDDLILL